ncbi:hypothetical protein CMUS01_08166 [Colletotrichum musicola]|uniref:Uncharacterized protein n=1 Tax=Colletotrichum musicola TaxID=2175873 RepID=A0A8H6NED2_9PEZI|nr:hypothetical protein CMUS01_08166 [Colletotrichum musicola]
MEDLVPQPAKIPRGGREAVEAWLAGLGNSGQRQTNEVRRAAEWRPEPMKLTNTNQEMILQEAQMRVTMENEELLRGGLSLRLSLGSLSGGDRRLDNRQGSAFTRVPPGSGRVERKIDMDYGRLDHT